MKRSFLFYLSLLSIVVAGCKAVDDSTNHNSSSTPKNIYTPQYTIDESFVGTTTDANNSRFSIENVEKHESIYNRIQSAKWVDDRRWDLYIDDINNGKKVLLPDLDLEESLNRLENLQKTKNVLDRQIELLDLRLDDRIIIKANGKESITSLKKGGKWWPVI